jgi:hypothetical protein
MLDVRAAYRSCRFRPQRDRFAVAFLKRVHFLRNDVCLCADGACEKFRLFENRRANLAEAVRDKNFAGGLLDAIPQRRIRREDVARSFDGLESHFNLER